MAAAIACITRATNPEPVILEVGVGSGRIAGPLAEAGLRVLGVDISSAMLATMRRVAPGVAAIRAEATCLPFRPNSLDAALFVQILHLVPDPRAAVLAAMTCVRPGGVLLELRTLAAPGPLDLVRRRIREESALLLGAAAREPRFESGSAALEACVLEGGGALDRGVICRWKETETLRDVLLALERRVYSAAWSLTDGQARRMAVQIAAEAETIAGGLDIPQHTSMTMLLTVGST